MMNVYNTNLLAAYVRGYVRRTKVPQVPSTLLTKPLDALTQHDTELLIEVGKTCDLKLYRFKNSDSRLPRVNRVLGFLKSISFQTLLDVGSGRGAFLFPFLGEFPTVEVTSVDILDHRVEFLSALSEGGISQLTAKKCDICELPMPDNSFDIVTLLEVLEHIPQVEAAVKNAVRLASDFVVVSVPSHEDHNPEHIHLLTKEKLTDLFAAAGCRKLHFDGVNGHLIAIANVQDVAQRS